MIMGTQKTVPNGVAVEKCDATTAQFYSKARCKKLIYKWFENKKPGESRAFIIQCNFYCSLGDFTKPSFASRLKVACGTALNRALSISLPVTRQIP